MSFTIYQNEKTPFYAIKTRSSKSLKDEILQKGLTHGLGPKMAIFHLFCIGNIGQENVFYDILQQKNAFLGYKNKKFKKSKNCHLSKEVNSCFWPKNGEFSTIFLRQYRQGKCVLRYFSNDKKPSQAIKTRGSKSLKFDIFPKGLNHGFGPTYDHFFNFFFWQ